MVVERRISLFFKWKGYNKILMGIELLVCRHDQIRKT